MAGILSYGAYVPYYRLSREAIAASLGTPAGSGARAVASADEDTTTMGVEAGRVALRGLGEGVSPRSVYFATADPAYLDKTNAAAIHGALGLPADCAAYDLMGSVRSGVGALRAALDASEPTLAILSDLRNGLAGGADERDGGDAAAAVVCGPGSTRTPVLAELITTASATAEFMDRWRVPGARSSAVWEERFGAHAYAPLAEQVVSDALKAADGTPDGVDHLIVTGTQSRAVGATVKGLVKSGARPESVVDDLSSTVGNAGTAQAGLLLASVLDTAEPGALIALVVLADGADALVFRTTDALVEHRSAPSVAEQIASGRDDLDYPTYLTWREALVREGPRRPDPVSPAGPPALRSEDWKFGFMGSRCTECGTRNLPPSRVCVRCRAVDHMEPEPLADVPATVATFTLDRLAPSLNPPVVAAVLDFDGGGRYQGELTDVDAAHVAIGDRVEMTFRRISSVDGVHNYFWKARPKREG
ncbi:MAG: OB-fold domain-containing protein [Acidimicrobiia bacterium]